MYLKKESREKKTFSIRETKKQEKKNKIKNKKHRKYCVKVQDITE